MKSKNLLSLFVLLFCIAGKPPSRDVAKMQTQRDFSSLYSKITHQSDSKSYRIESQKNKNDRLKKEFLVSPKKEMSVKRPVRSFDIDMPLLQEKSRKKEQLPKKEGQLKKVRPSVQRHPKTTHIQQPMNERNLDRSHKEYIPLNPQIDSPPLGAPFFQWGMPLKIGGFDEQGLLLRNFYIDGTVSFYETYKALNECGKRAPIQEFIFGGPVVLQDIYLASYLGMEGKITLDGASPPFGASREEQYISCLGPTTLCLDLKREKLTGEINLFYLFDISDSEQWTAALGIHIPFKRIRHHLSCFQPKNGLIACSPTIGIGENNIDQFFSDNLNYIDFLSREVLEPKCLDLNCFQERRGIGDLEANLSFIYQGYGAIRNVCLGVSTSFLTSKKRKGCLVWEPSLGKEGSRKFSLFGGLYTNVWRPFNPFIAAEFSTFSTADRDLRLPELKTTGDQVLIPERFSLHTIQPFQAYDSKLREFSDELHPSKVKPGRKTKILIGNEWNYIFRSPLHVTVYYRYLRKTKSTICPCDTTRVFNTGLLEEITDKVQQSLFFNFSGYLSSRFGVNLAVQHVLSGKNTYSMNKLSVSLVGNF